jgi:mono/diheme cytochrome c family protein
MRALVLLLLFAAGPAWAAAPALPRSVDVTLPDGSIDLPQGPGRDVAVNNCVACHSADFIAAQPPQPPAVWAAEVAKMRKVMHAPVNDADAATIVAYLVAVKGSH